MQPTATIKPDDDPVDVPAFVSHWPNCPPSPQHPPLDMSILPPSMYTKSLADLDCNELIERLYLVEQNKGAPAKDKGKSTTPLDCMNQDKIITLRHHPSQHHQQIAHAILQTRLVPNPIEWQKNYIELPDVDDFGIIGT